MNLKIVKIKNNEFAVFYPGQEGILNTLGDLLETFDEIVDAIEAAKSEPALSEMAYGETLTVRLRIR